MSKPDDMDSADQVKGQMEVSQMEVSQMDTFFDIIKLFETLEDSTKSKILKSVAAYFGIEMSELV